ncbi:MAG: inositol monophosphatase family protein [Thermoplasmata archaeon]
MSGLTSPDLEVLFRINAAVHSAVREARSSPHRGDVVAMGADGSPTEQIDQVAERTILDRLDAEGVDWDLLSEEIGLVRRGGGPLLVADPIDGTHNLLHGLPFASISLALGARDLSGVEIGVVHDLYHGTTYWAQRGGGAFRDGRTIRVRPWNPKSDLTFVSLGRHTTDRAVGRGRQARRIRSLGCASLEMVKVAEGAGDAYLFENQPESLNLRVTDIAAGYRILIEAGGGISDADGDPIDRFPLSVEPRTSVFAFGDAQCLAALLTPRGR